MHLSVMDNSVSQTFLSVDTLKKLNKFHGATNSHMNQFMLIASSITGDSEKDDDHFFWEITTFSGNIT